MIIALQALYLFQKSLLAVFEQILEPYLKNIFFYKSSDVYSEEDNEDDVYSEYDENKGVIFFPPVYLQRYAAVSDCLLDTRWKGQLEKIIDFGCNDMSFIKYLKDIPGVTEILGVDLEPIPITLDLKHDRYSQKRENPLKITVYQGNAADPDYRLLGCDAVVSIEMIEHMLPHDLERFVHNIFGFIKPWVVVITTPNGDFNTLFKALEPNGLRRLDHFFEWSREQFHDWCSNIVTRYPDYSVSCKGIGPGPPGTSHLGCCSQLALFVLANYQKQTELRPNSLAIVERESNSAMSDSMDSWDMTESIENSVQSLTTYKCESVPCVTSTLNTPIQNKNVQCDMKKELARNYLMFDEDTSCICMARDWFMSVYFIENVSNRLNCTNNQIKRFSKTTHQLMAKNKEDTLANARDLVGEIRHLSKIANLGTQETIWKNINWGEDAPYWNKYYKIMKEYSHPFAVRSDETRILETISEEITRLIYTSGEDSFLQDDKIEIPIGYIMGLISHITDDEYQVRELLEWNGYEVAGDTVVYAKLLQNEPVDLQKEWIDVASIDWSSADSQSLEMLENLTEPDLFEYGLLISLDQKIHSLQRLSKRKDVPFEIEKLVHRLVDLVRDVRGGLPHPMLVYKLYDLLRVTEKAIVEQRRNFVDDCKKAIRFSKRYKEDMNIIISIGIEKAFKTETILERYESILDTGSDQSIENLEYDFNDDFLNPQTATENMSFEDTDPCGKTVLLSYDTLVEDHQLRDVSYKDIQTNSDDITKWNSYRSTEYLHRNNKDTVVVIKAQSMRKKRSKFREHKKKLKHKRYRMIRSKFAPGLNYFKNKNIEKVKIYTEENSYVSMSKSIGPIPNSLINLYNLSQSKIVVNRENSFGAMNEQATIEDQYNAIIKNSYAKPSQRDTANKKSLELKETPQEGSEVNEKIHQKPLFFTHDIDEPSTSDGIRHISADIQCGPDDAINLAHARSLTYLSNIPPKRQYTTLNIKASITDFQNTISTNTSNHAFDNFESRTKEYVLGYQNNKENRNDATENFCANNVVSKRHALSYGGIYVHCYKNENSEDIVYQGKWQECISIDMAKKAPFIQYRRRKEVPVKKNIVVTENVLSRYEPAFDNREHKSKISYRNTLSQRKLEKVGCVDVNEKKNIRQVRLIKPIIGIKSLETYAPVKKNLVKSQIFDINNYIPAYLKRRINKCLADNKLNLNLNIVLNTYNKRPQLSELHLKTSGYNEMDKCKPNRCIRKIPIYQVFRNEIDKVKKNTKGLDKENLRKCIPTNNAYVPCSSCSNYDVSFRIKNNCAIGYLSKNSSSHNPKPGNYTNSIKRIRNLKCAKSLITTKVENVVPHRSETVTETSNDFYFSNDKLHKFEKVKDAHRVYTNKVTKIDTGDSQENEQINTDSNVKEYIVHLIDETLNYVTRCSTPDKKYGTCNISDEADDKDAVNYNYYTSTFTLPTTSSAKTETSVVVQNKKSSDVSMNVCPEDFNINSGYAKDVEFLSSISVASAATSKFSDYLSADNEFEDLSSSNCNSIFSLPLSPIIKENTTKVSDLSQRSSQDSYMSCSTENDLQIPSWFFESDSEPDRTVTSLLENETEVSALETQDETGGYVVGYIGAGDGRGIHSDLSRDTSGRGTSFSRTISLESESTPSSRSSGQTEFSAVAQCERSAEGAVTSVDTTQSSPLIADATCLDNEYEMDSETFYSTI